MRWLPKERADYWLNHRRMEEKDADVLKTIEDEIKSSAIVKGADAIHPQLGALRSAESTRSFAPIFGATGQVLWRKNWTSLAAVPVEFQGQLAPEASRTV